MASTNIQSFPGVVEIASNLTVDTNTLHVDSVAGRVGIGKTDPAFALDVSGTINATSFYLGGSELQTGPWTSDDPNIYYTGGQAGIGTNSPAKTLEVQGTLRTSNASTGEVSDLFVTTSNTWSQQQRLAPIVDPAPYDNFGRSVSISGNGNTAIVGVWKDDDTYTDSGSAYIFTRSGSSWSQQTKITNPDPAGNDQFGYSVAISEDGNTVIVGAAYDDIAWPNQGSAYIFTRFGSSWTQHTRLLASDRAQTDYFGNAVGISGDGNTAIVGAYADDDDGGVINNSGSAYIFTRSGDSWSEHKIPNPDPSGGDQFGNAVAISSDGNTVIVGAAYDDDATYVNSGSAYIFTRSGSSWTEQQHIPNPDPQQYDNFGHSVAISGDGNTAIMGAFLDTVTAYQQGSAYIFTRSGSSWSQQAQLVASDAAQADYFGWSVGISGDGTTALVGSPQDDDAGNSSGSAYIFTRSGSSWTQQQKLKASDEQIYDEFGTSVAISANGTTAIVGAWVDDAIYVDGGSAYIFNSPGTSLTSTTLITAEGTILSFTGQHMCFPDGPMGQGQIVSANKNKYITLNGPLTTGVRAIKSSESLPVVCLSNVANDISVFGVVDRHEQGGTTRVQESGIGKVTQEKEWGDNRVIVNSIGEGAMWVANTNGNLTSGDYITTSNVAGYGQKQDDDTVYSYTVAKITMDCDFEPEDLPVQVIKKDAQGNNVLDAYGRIQWEDTDRTEKAYRIRYLTTEGQRTDQANAVWTAAYVGCTYHCG
jgi:hypothetical protein